MLTSIRIIISFRNLVAVIRILSNESQTRWIDSREHIKIIFFGGTSTQNLKRSRIVNVFLLESIKYAVRLMNFVCYLLVSFSTN